MDPQQVLLHMSDGLLSVDRSWRITSGNPAAETLLQRRSAELVGASLWERLPDSASSRVESELREVMDGHVARRVEHFSPSRYTWFEIRAVPVSDGLLLFLRNVTDRARLLQTEAVQAAVRRILMEAPVAMAILRGSEHRFEITNTLHRKLVGGRELEGRAIRSVFPELEGSGQFELLDEVYRTGRAFTGKNITVRYDREGIGTLYEGVFDITYQPLFEPDGRTWGILTVAVEVTEYVRERLRMEEAAAQG